MKTKIPPPDMRAFFPPAITIVQKRREAPGEWEAEKAELLQRLEWERERDELRAKVAGLEADVRRLAPKRTIRRTIERDTLGRPSALVQELEDEPDAAPPRVIVSTTSSRCWQAIARLVSTSAALGPVRVIRMDFDQIDREAGYGRTSPEARRIVLEDMAKEAREDREFWLAHPDIRELRFDEVASASSLVPVSPSPITPSRVAPAAVARMVSPIGFRP